MRNVFERNCPSAMSSASQSHRRSESNTRQITANTRTYTTRQPFKCYLCNCEEHRNAINLEETQVAVLNNLIQQRCC